MTVLPALQAIPSWPYLSWLGQFKSPAGSTVTLRCFKKYSTGPDEAIDTSNGPVGQVQAEIWLLKKKLDFQKNVKVHFLKKAQLY